MTFKLNKIIPIIITSITILFIGYLIFSGCLEDIHKLEKMIQSFGIVAPLIFIAIQIIQVVIPIIPGGLSSSIGVVLFGPLWGFIYNFTGILIGSIIVFKLVRKYGKNFILNFFEESTYNKYVNWISDKHRFELFFFIAILIPGLPDDLICMISALTNISLRKYILINIICRPVSLLAYSWSISELMSFIKSI